jgi:hypothetical protein
MAFGQLSACDASGNAANEAAARHIAIARRKRRAKLPTLRPSGHEGGVLEVQTANSPPRYFALFFEGMHFSFSFHFYLIAQIDDAMDDCCH